MWTLGIKISLNEWIYDRSLIYYYGKLIWGYSLSFKITDGKEIISFTTIINQLSIWLSGSSISYRNYRKVCFLSISLLLSSFMTLASYLRSVASSDITLEYRKESTLYKSLFRNPLLKNSPFFAHSHQNLQQISSEPSTDLFLNHYWLWTWARPHTHT